MSEYTTERTRGATERVLVRQTLIRRTSAGLPAVAGTFSRLYETACMLFLLRPQAIYYLAFLATNRARALLTETVDDLQDMIFGLMDAADSSAPIRETDSLSAASKTLRTAASVMALGTEVRGAGALLKKYAHHLDEFLYASLRPNVRKRVGDRRTLTPLRVGTEALQDVLEHFLAFQAEYVQFFQLLEYIRAAVPLARAAQFRSVVSPLLLNRTRAQLEAAEQYYERATEQEAAATASTVLLNALTGRASIRAVQSARSVRDPKVRSRSLNRDDPQALPAGSDYILRPAGAVVPAAYTGVSPVQAALPVGTGFVYAPSGGADRTVTIPGAGLDTIIGSVDLNTPVTIPAGVALYLEDMSGILVIPLTAGNRTVNQVVSDINAASLGLASRFGSTGRLILTRSQPFRMLRSFSGDQVASVQATLRPVFQGNGETFSVIVQDANGLHTQQFVMPVGDVNSVAQLVTLMNVPSFTQTATGIPVLTVSSSGDVLTIASVLTGSGVSIAVDVVGSTAVTAGAIPWPTGAASGLGVVVQTSTTLDLLGLLQESNVLTEPAVVVGAVNDVEPSGSVVASLNSAGHLVLTSMDTTLTSSIEVKSGTGLTELGLVVGIEKAEAQYLEVWGTREGDTVQGVADLATLGLVVGDRVTVMDQEVEYSASVAETPSGTRLRVGTGVPADLGDSRFTAEDGQAAPYRNSMEGVRRAVVLQTRSTIPSLTALEHLRRRLEARSGAGLLSRGDVKKFVAPLLDALSILTDTPSEATALDARLPEFGLSRPVAGYTLESGLTLSTPGADAETVAAVDGLIASFEERGFDRAAYLLVTAQIQAFLELTPSTASRSGNLESAIRASAGIIQPPRTEATMSERGAPVAALNRGDTAYTVLGSDE